jgi:polyhydroxybutyrate depolymerase
MKTLITTFLVTSFLGLSAQTTDSGSFNYDGEARSYQIYVPAAYTPGTAVPVVLNLHGYGSNNTQQMAYGTFKAIADTANFLILAPLGIPDGTGTAHWNANWGTGVDDIGFINALLDTISNNYSVNQNRIYSTGMSNGGFMSLTLAGQLDNRIAAVASVTGTMSTLQIPENTVTRPVPVMQIHGTNDPTVAYNGDAYFISVDSVINYWVGHNNCNTTPVFTAIADVNTSDGCTAELYEYLGGDNGAEVVQYKVIDGAHTWPGAPVTLGVTNQDFNASVVIWEFFNKYEKSSLVSVNELSNDEKWFNLISENPTDGFIKFQALDSELYDVIIMDINGKQVSRIENQMDVSSVNFSSQVAGIYLVQLKNSSHSALFKIVKK